MVWRGLATQNYPPAAVPLRARPFVFRSPARARARLGNSLACADGIASQIVTPLGAPQFSVLAVVAHIPPPARARLGSAGRSGAGFVSKAITPPLGTPSRPKPFVFRSPAPARARLGSNLQPAAGVASRIVTPLGSPSRPKPFVFRSPAPARARLGNSLLCAGGLASQIVTPLGTPSRPRPFVFRSPAPARGKTGPRGLPASGIASVVVTPLGSAPQPPPRPVIVHVPPRRVLWHGYAVQVTALPATAYRRPPVQVRRPAPARAHTGPRGLAAGGITSQVVTPRGSIPAPRKVQIFPPKTTRARIGHGTVAGGITSTAITPVAPIGIPQQTVPVVEFRPPPPARALWHGIAAPVAVPVRPVAKPFVFRSPARARARLGSNLQPAGGIASQVVTPRGAAQLTVPVLEYRPPRQRGIWHGTAPVSRLVPVTAYRRSPPLPRSPAPHRALWRGFASKVVTPRGAAQPTVPVLEFRPPPPTRALWRGIAAPYARIGPQQPLGFTQPSLPLIEFRPPLRVPGAVWHGFAALPPAPVAPVGPTAYRRPAPQVKRPAPARAWIGRGGPAGGLASQIVTPRGTPQPTVPVLEYRPPPPHRALWRGIAVRLPVPLPATVYQRPPPPPRHPLPHRALWRGFASTVVTPLGSVGKSHPFVFPGLPRTRARLGPAGATGSGIAAPPAAAPVTPGAAQPTVPIVEFRPAPSRRVLWRGTITRIQAAVTVPVTAYRRPPVQMRRIPPRRVLWRGFASRIVTPLGAPQPTVPIVEFRPPPPARALWRGIAAPYARIGPQQPLGSTQPSLPLLEFRPPPPPRGYTGPHRVIGLTNLPPPPPVVTAYQRPAPRSNARPRRGHGWGAAATQVASHPGSSPHSVTAAAAPAAATTGDPAAPAPGLVARFR